MSRGYYWEATYDPDWNGPGPDEDLLLTVVEPGETIEGKRLVAPPNESSKVRWHDKDATRTFIRCDFPLHVEGDFITKCAFRFCRFKGSSWQNVRFSKCTFENCDFSEVIFKRCYFLGSCEFRDNTASGEAFRMEETSISASAFMAGLVANLTYEKRDKIRYSKHKFVKTRAKIASVIYRATQNEADFDFYTQAYEHFIRCTLLERVERHRYDEDTGSEVDWIRFMCRSLLDRFDKVIILTSGSLTDWGRSVWRPVLVFTCIVAFFTVYYAVAIGISPLSPWRDLRRAVVTATNITLVAGYDAQYQKAFPGLCNWAGFLTLLWACFGIP